jgi:hypothetical protein
VVASHRFAPRRPLTASFPGAIRHLAGRTAEGVGRVAKQAPGAARALLRHAPVVIHFETHWGGRRMRGRSSTVLLVTGPPARDRGRGWGRGSVRMTESWVSQLFMNVWVASSTSHRSQRLQRPAGDEPKIVDANPELHERHTVTYHPRMPGLKWGRTWWLAMKAGGPFLYTGKEMRDAHFRPRDLTGGVRRSVPGAGQRPG